MFFIMLKLVVLASWNDPGWSEPATTNAKVQNEAIQAVLGMNQKHILFHCPGIFQTPHLPQMMKLT